MKIAISSTELSPNAWVDFRFGRCRCFAIVDVEADTWDYIDNEAAALGGGAGLQAAQMIADTGVDAVITGNLGPNASSVLEAAGIKTVFALDKRGSCEISQCFRMLLNLKD